MRRPYTDMATRESVAALDKAEVRRLELAPGDYVLLSVTDTGTGIPPEILDRVLSR